MNNCYPTSTANNNVPQDVFLVAEEPHPYALHHVRTYYITPDGDIKVVASTQGSFAEGRTMRALRALTGDTEKMINARFQTWLRVFRGE